MYHIFNSSLINFIARHFQKINLYFNVKIFGVQNFKRGINHYLSEFAYNNATTEDLWRSLEKFCNKPIEEVRNNCNL